MHGIAAQNTPSGEIWVTEFTDKAAAMFRAQMLMLSDMDPSAPITIYIDSYGGNVDALAMMVATIDEVPNPIITAVYGKAMSCGAILLSHGDMRFCDPHARVMIHRVSSGTYGDVEEQKNDVAETDRLNKYWMGFLAVNCGLENYAKLNEFIKSKEGLDRFLDASAAKQFGIVDVVGRPIVQPRVVYEVITGPEKISIHKRAKIRQEETKKETTPKRKPRKKARRKK